MDMGNDVQELIEKFQKLIPENKISALSTLRVALVAQENTRKAMESERSRKEGAHEQPAA